MGEGHFIPQGDVPVKQGALSFPQGDVPATLKWNEAGLIAAIVQDARSDQVLMLAWMNQEALQRTMTTGETWFWSRSRQELWHKGGSSGHIQKVEAVFYDCDGDALLVKVQPAGPACHTGEQSCFFNQLTHDA